MEMETKTNQVKRLVAAGEYKKALQICKDWNYENPRHRSLLQLGYACHMYPKFYQQLGYEPEDQWQLAIQVLHDVYD